MSHPVPEAPSQNHGPAERMRPSEHLLNTASQLFQAAGMEGSAKAMSAMNQFGHMTHDGVSKLLGNNVSISGMETADKLPTQKFASTDSTSQAPQRGQQSEDPLSHHEKEALRFGQLDGDAREHVGHTDHATLSAALDKKTADQIKAQQQSPSVETVAARTSTALSQSERTKLLARIQKNESEKITKRQPSKDLGRLPDRISIKPEQAAHNHESAPNKLEHGHTGHKPDNSAKHPEQDIHKPEISEHHQSETKIDHKPEPIDSHKSDNPIAHKPEGASVHSPETKTTHKSDSTLAPKTDATAPEKKTSSTPVAEHTNHKSTTEQAKDNIESKQIEHTTKARENLESKQPEHTTQPKEQVAAKQPEHTAQAKEKVATQQVEHTAPVKEPVVKPQPAEHTSTSPTAEKQNQSAPVTSLIKTHTDSTGQLDKPGSLSEPNLAKGPDQKGETKAAEQAIKSEARTDNSKVAANEIRVAAKESTATKEEVEKPSAQNNHLDDDRVALHVSEHAENVLDAMGHGPGNMANANLADASAHHVFDASAHTLARSSVSDASHHGEFNKVHSVHHVPSALEKHSGKIDSMRITHDPEIQTHNKGATQGTSATSTTGTTTAASSSHNGHDSHGHSGHHSSIGHTPGGHLPPGHSHDPKGQNPSSKTDPTNSQSGSSPTKAQDPGSTANQPGSDKSGQPDKNKTTGQPGQTTTSNSNNPTTNSGETNTTGSKPDQPANPGSNTPGNNPGQPNNPTTNNPVSNGGYYGPIVVEQPSGNGYREAAFLLELFAEIGFMASLASHNPGRRMSPGFADITNPAIPGNMVTRQPAADQQASPFNVPSTAQVPSQLNIPNPSSPIDTSPISAQNPTAENPIGVNINPVISEPAGHIGTDSSTNGNGADGQIPSGSNSPTSGPALNGPLSPDNPLPGQLGNIPFNNPSSGPLGSIPFNNPGPGPLANTPFNNPGPYLTGSVDYSGGNPAVVPSAPSSPSAHSPLSPEYGSYDPSGTNGQPYHSGHVESDNGQSQYAPYANQQDNRNDNSHEQLGRHHTRPEIADPWQTLSVHGDKGHHQQESGNSQQDNKLDNHQQNRHDSLVSDWWQGQNNGGKNVQTTADGQPTNGLIFPVLTENLIGQLVGLLTDGKNTKAQNQQARTYTVKAGDTLESIGTSILADYRLGQLIFIINRALFQSQTDWRLCKLREGLVLFLPAPEEIHCFRLAMIEKEKQNKALKNLPTGDQTTKENLDQDTLKNLAKRRSNIERLLGSFSSLFSYSQPSTTGRESVTVRLGDTLRSIALKHPSLNDVSLWKLLAQLNELSMAVDVKGVPTAILTRGMTLELPTAAEIAEYRTHQANSIRSASPRKALQTEVLVN